MKSNQKIRQIIRQILSEEMMSGTVGAGINAGFTTQKFHGYPSGVQNFPYGEAKLPEDIGIVNNDSKDDSFNKISQNNDVYEFPMEEFQNGLEKEIEQEKEQNSFIDVFSVAQNVLNNLKSDKEFYQKNEE